MFWLYRIATVERLKWENEQLRAENKKLSDRLMMGIGEMFTDTEDPQGDREFEQLKRSKDNREKFDDFAGDRFGG